MDNLKGVISTGVVLEGAVSIPPQGIGNDGATFTPVVSAEGEISWTNNGGLENPTPVNIKGPKGDKGADGAEGKQGPQGLTGDTGAEGKQGPQGLPGEPGVRGERGKPGKDGFSPIVTVGRVIDGVSVTVQDKDGMTSQTVYDGRDATINGVNALLLKQGENIILDQQGDQLYINAKSGGVGQSGEGESSEIFNDMQNNIAQGHFSHAEGYMTKAKSHFSHAEGNNTEAFGRASHAEGLGTLTFGDYQHVQGKYNSENESYADIVGNGTGDATNQRSNAYTLDWNGNGWYSGVIKMGGTSYDSTDAKLVATTDYVDWQINQTIGNVLKEAF